MILVVLKKEKVNDSILIFKMLKYTLKVTKCAKLCEFRDEI